MVKAELDMIPIDKRSGPLVVSEATGRPCAAGGFEDAWQADFAAADVLAGIWSDLRAAATPRLRAAGHRMVGPSSRAIPRV
jgi:hypothetical protein